MSVSCRRFSRPAGRSKTLNFRVPRQRWRTCLSRFLRSDKLGTVDSINTNPNVSDASPGDTAALDSPESQLASVTAERDKLAAATARIAETLDLRTGWNSTTPGKRAERERIRLLAIRGDGFGKGSSSHPLTISSAPLQVETADRNYAKGVELILSAAWPKPSKKWVWSRSKPWAGSSTRTCTRPCGARRDR